MQGSCLHFTAKSTLFPSLSTVVCLEYILEVGFTAILNTTSSQVVIPPRIPPYLLCSVHIFQSLFWNHSLYLLPVSSVTPNPAPYSNPSTHPIDNIELANLVLILSNTGSPTP